MRRASTFLQEHSALLNQEVDSDDFNQSKTILEEAQRTFNTALKNIDLTEEPGANDIFNAIDKRLGNYLQSNGRSWDNPAAASTQQTAATPENQPQAGANAALSDYHQLAESINISSRLEHPNDNSDGSATAAMNLLKAKEDQLKDKTQADILEHMKTILDDSDQSDLHKGAEFVQAQITELMATAQAASSPQADTNADAATPKPPAQTAESAQETAARSKLSDLIKPISEVPNKPGSYHVPPDSVGKIMSTVNKNHGGGLNALDKQGYGVIDEAEAQAILGDQKKLAELVTKMTGIQPNTPNFKAAQDHVKKALEGVGKGGCVGLAVSNQAHRADLHKDIQEATNSQAKFVEQKGPSKSTRAPTPAPAPKRQRAESSTSVVNDFGGKAYDTTAEPSPEEQQAAFKEGAGSKETRRLRSNSAPASSTEHSNDDDNQRSPQI